MKLICNTCGQWKTKSDFHVIEIGNVQCNHCYNIKCDQVISAEIAHIVDSIPDKFPEIDPESSYVKLGHVASKLIFDLKCPYPIDQHVFAENGKWHFWDEAGLESYGPYPDKDTARRMLKEYAKMIDGNVNHSFAAEVANE